MTYAFIALAEAAIAAYQARMGAVPLTYQPGDRVEFCGEVYEIFRYQREGESGYWLRGKDDEVFIPVDHEEYLHPVVH